MPRPQKKQEEEEKKPIADEKEDTSKANAEEQPQGNEQQKQPLPDLTVNENMTEEEMLAKIDAKIKAARRLTETECLFCSHNADTFEANMEHMTLAHSFFIPDIEYLVDLKGLVRYLGEKISVGNVCLYCNGKGREMRSLEAVRKHMVSAWLW